MARLAVWALALALIALFVSYALGWGTGRNSVESWALTFVIVGLVFRLGHSPRLAAEEPIAPTTFGPWPWVLFCALSIVLYGPALWFEFQPPDLALLRRASEWNLEPDGPTSLRLLPTVVWALLIQLGAGAVSLRLLNVVLHGTNAYLAGRIIGGWVPGRAWALTGGLLVLTAPLATEPVVSPLRVSDLLSVTFVLTCVLIARRYEAGASAATRILFVGAGLAAAASKETAVIAGGLVLLDAWIRSARSRPLLVDTGILLSIAAAFSLVRLGLAYGVVLPPLNRYVVQLALFRSFGSLAVPWHIEVLERWTLLPILGVLAVVYLLAIFFLSPAPSRGRTKLAIGAAAWVLLSVVPVFPILFIAPELHQSRYLYLSAIGWAGVIAALASERPVIHGPSAPAVATALLVATAIAGTIIHVGYAGPGGTFDSLRRRLFAELQPVTLANCQFQRFGEPNDGGYLLCANLLSAVRSGYSYGISGYDQWGCDVSRTLSVPVHQYDCFNLTRPVCTTGNTVFHEECIGGEPATIDGRLFDTLEYQFARNGDAARRLVVKMDVEGAEWDSLAKVPEAVLRQIDQLTIELHGIDEDRFLVVLRRLKQSFYLANVHFNNFACASEIGPFPATVYEVLFVSKRVAVRSWFGRAGAPPGLTTPNNPQTRDCQT